MMKMKLKAAKTYATEENADRAAEEKFGSTSLRYFVHRGEDGRFFPVFVGQEAVAAMAHFHFNVIG